MKTVMDLVLESVMDKVREYGPSALAGGGITSALTVVSLIGHIDGLKQKIEKEKDPKKKAELEKQLKKIDNLKFVGGMYGASALAGAAGGAYLKHKNKSPQRTYSYRRYRY